ncbi:hypothetical protein ACIHAA_01870 [Streptomyces sp. NPDC052040]|uniref:hypothetical protein n=1 Tax=unclassified Streptomyces TaxID=2593676 RepID=UPI0037D58E39
MGWKQAFDDAMRELREGRKQLDRLDDPTVGLSALRGEITQSRLKILEAVQGGVTGLREENREVRRRQDRLINDLNDTRAELRQLLDLADVLRNADPLPSSVGRGESSATGDGPSTPSPRAEDVLPADSAASTGHTPGSESAADTHPRTEPGTDEQGDTMTTIDQQPQPLSGSGGKDLVLKQAIESAYRGTQAPAGAAAAAPQPSSTGPEDPRIAHGLLLLRAAGVASAELVAHRDTWEWLAARAVHHGHFRTPPAVEDIKEGRVRTVLSGRTLIALLIELWNTRSDATPLEGDWALATTSYRRIEAELTDVTGQGETISIVLDDGTAHDPGD